MEPREESAHWGKVPPGEFYALAIANLGGAKGVGQLTDTTVQTVKKTWKRRGIPRQARHVLERELVARGISHPHRPQSAQTDRFLRDEGPTLSSQQGALMPHEQQVALQQMTRIFNDHARPDRWATLKVLLDTWAPASELAVSRVSAARDVARARRSSR